MPLDTFICGSCMVSFNDIEQFILHKNDVCGKANETTTEAVEVIQQDETNESISVLNKVDDISEVHLQEHVSTSKLYPSHPT